jgi:hypothetical protein
MATLLSKGTIQPIPGQQSLSIIKLNGGCHRPQRLKLATKNRPHLTLVKKYNITFPKKNNLRLLTLFVIFA